jgi:hypothetical protein
MLDLAAAAAAAQLVATAAAIMGGLTGRHLCCSSRFWPLAMTAWVLSLKAAHASAHLCCAFVQLRGMGATGWHFVDLYILCTSAVLGVMGL